MALGNLLFLIVPIALITGFAVCFIWCAREWAISYGLRKWGSDIEAEIVDKHIHISRRTTAYIIYSFSDSYGRSYKREVSVNMRKYGNWVKGETVQVRFLPNNPAISRMPNEYLLKPFLTVVTIVTLFLAAYFIGLSTVPILLAIWLIVFYIILRLLARPVTRNVAV